MRHKKFSSIGSIVNPNKIYVTKRAIDKLIIHCSATRNTQDVSSKQIDEMHLRRWGKASGMGYHYYVRKDGTVEKGRWVDNKGAHAGKANVGSIGVCYEGGVDKDMKVAMESCTKAQKKSLLTLCETIINSYNIKPSNVRGHGELAGVNKACPCLDMDNFRKDIS